MSTRRLMGSEDSPRQPLTSGELHASSFPAGPSDLVGRDRELDEIISLVEHGTVVTLTGFGGVGKTSLALEVARTLLHEGVRFTDSMWFCELAPVVEGGAIPIAVLDAVGMFQNEDASAYDSVVTGLRGLSALLILDNCEQVAGVAGSFAQKLVTDCPDLAVLATSREPLRIAAEHVVPVEPLGLDRAAQELFIRRATEADPFFQSLENQTAIAEICRSLDGLPLALELAAARVVSMSAEDVARRLDERFRMLRDPTSRERNDSLHATVSWSYELLEPIERRLFDRLSVFQGGFDDRAAEAIIDPRDRDADIREVLAALVDKSMVGVVAVDNPDTGEGRRYGILETLRHFGDRQLARRNERSVVRNQHLDHVVGLVAEANALVLGNDWKTGAKLFARNWDNIRAAINWAIDTTRVDDVDRLLRDTFFYCRWALEPEAANWAERALSRGPTTGAVAGTPAHLHVGFQHFLAGNHEAALAALLDGVGARGTPSDRGWCRHYAAVELLYLGRAAEAAEQAAADLDETTPRDVEMVMRSSSLSTFQVWTKGAKHPTMQQELERHTILADATQNAVAIGSVKYNRALCAYAGGEVEEYIVLMREALEIARRENIPNLTGYVLTAQVYGPGWNGLRAALEALQYWGQRRDIGNEFVVMEAAAINLAELRRFEPAAIILGNLETDRRRISSSASRRAAALGEIGLHRKSEAWFKTGEAMSRRALLDFTQRAVLDALGSM